MESPAIVEQLCIGKGGQGLRVDSDVNKTTFTNAVGEADHVNNDCQPLGSEGAPNLNQQQASCNLFIAINIKAASELPSDSGRGQLGAIALRKRKFLPSNKRR